MPTIVPLTPTHATAAARLHIDGQPGTFLTSLGPGVLRALYLALPQSSVGFGAAALDDSALGNSASEAAISGANLENVLGFVSATTSVGRLFLEMGTRHLPQFVPPLLAQYARHPSLLLRSVQTVLYPFLVRNDDAVTGSAPAELLSIMVEPSARGQGIGSALMETLLIECRERQIALLDVTVDAHNTDACRFYEQHGFAFVREFVLYGRVMCLYQLRLHRENADH